MTLARLRREDGFTLTELLVAMPLLALILAAIAGTLVVLNTINGQTTGQLTQQATYFPTLDAMVQDLQTMTPPSLGGSPLIAADSISLSFYSPDQVSAQSGPTSPFHLREVAYRFSGGALQKQQVASTNTYTTVTSTTPWGSWTSSLGTFPLTGFPSATRWRTLLGTGLTDDGSSPAIASAGFSYYDAEGHSIATPVSAASLGLVRTILVTVTAAVAGAPSRQTTYTNTAEIRETQPTS
jgi:prepilin-type N-terminal cleavage/methylation domain-containing protein